MSGFVYFLRSIQGTGPVKIGHTIDVSRRLAELSQWCPEPLDVLLTIPGDRALERNIQNCFFDDHYHHEWFHVSARLERAIRQIAAGTPVEQAIDLSDLRGNIRFKAAEATRLRNGSPQPWVTRKINAERRRALLAERAATQLPQHSEMEA